MSTKRTELLLVENVENLGIVGDIVKVKTGYARNYLLPMGLAEKPTPTRIEGLKERRAAAEAEVSRLRGAREELLSRMNDIAMVLTRSCNDQGVLYGSVTQRDIADGLQDSGYDVGTRSIRLSNPIRRVGEYTVPIQFDKDLRTEISLVVEPDQPLEERDEMEIDDEGELVEKPKPQAKADDTKAESAEPANA